VAEGDGAARYPLDGGLVGMRLGDVVARGPLRRGQAEAVFEPPGLRTVNRVQPSRTVCPVAADRRAASRISVTTTLFLNDDRPEGLISPLTTAAK